jgi:rubrerythrin
MRSVKILILVVASSLTLISTPLQKPSKVNPQTRDNLMTAMKGEAFAYAKYMAYAQHARKSGNVSIANLFEQTAKVEHLEHFQELAELAQLAGTDADNLRDAIQGESQESQTMYPHFAEQAAAAGDSVVAERFREIAQDEMKHKNMFRDALASLENKTQ